MAKAGIDRNPWLSPYAKPALEVDVVGGGTTSVPLERHERGLVICSPIEASVGTNEIRFKGAQIDPQELRIATLFWDKLVWPKSNFIHLGSGPDEDFLEKSGILARPNHTVYGEAAASMVSSQLQAFEQLQSASPGQWALAQGERTLNVIGNVIRPGTNAQLELLRAIPVPDYDVPLEEVLAFRARRAAELSSIRRAIDDLVAELAESPEPSATLNSLIERVDAACVDAIRVGTEWQFPVRLMNLKTTYEVRPLVSAAAGAAAFIAAQTAGLPLTAALLAAGTGTGMATLPALKMSFDGFQFVGLKPEPGPFHYAYLLHKELF